MTGWLWIWLIATLGHFFVSAQLTRVALEPNATSFDEWAFTAILGGVGGLSVVLHAVAISAGLSLGAGLAALALWELAWWILIRRTRARVAPAARPAAWRPIGAEILAAIVMAGVVLAWIGVASQTMAIDGTDGAHYHVPFAVNLALGASPFDLPATPHLYPMAGSVIDAWFIVPTGDPLLVDLAMCVPFLLFAASVNWLFCLATGLPGAAWSSWLTLALFSTPLFRVSSLGSADLWFASAFLALTAALAAIWTRRAARAPDIVLVALSCGLLVGCKTSGVAAAGLILGTYGVAEIARSMLTRRPWTFPRHLLTVSVGSVLLFLGAGGIWLVRNWLRFGSPVAPAGVTMFGIQIFSGDPFTATTYLSVLGDLQKSPSYQFIARTRHFIRVWLGPWFLTALLPLVLVPIDFLFARKRGRAATPWRARAFILAMGFGVGGGLIWLLVGAPWTSLEWTNGLALRYVLPLAALWPLAALLGLFPTAWRWYDDILAARMVAAGLALVSLFLLWTRIGLDQPGGVTVPNLTAGTLGAGLVLIVVAFWAKRQSARIQPLVAGIVVLALASWWAPVIARRDVERRGLADEKERQERAEFSRNAAGFDPERAVYLATLASEDASGRACTSRRFYALVRFDEPLTLQSTVYRNRVFYAGRDVQQARDAGPLARCDYVITTRAMMGTDKGSALVSALAGGASMREVATPHPFVVLGTR